MKTAFEGGLLFAGKICMRCGAGFVGFGSKAFQSPKETQNDALMGYSVIKSILCVYMRLSGWFFSFAKCIYIVANTKE